MNTKILIALLVIVATAGCTIPGIEGITPPILGGGGKGLEITSFTATPTKTYNGSTVTLSMALENQGGATTKSTSSFAFLADVNVGSADNSEFHGTSTDAGGSSCKPLTDMKTADVIKGTPGDKKTVKWLLRAPDYGSGVVTTPTITGRVYYDYTTTVNGNVWVYSETESNAASSSGKSLNKASFTSSSGPIGLEVSATPDPVVQSGDNTFTLDIKVSNNGGGTVYSPNLDYSTCASPPTADDLNKVIVNVKVPTGFTNDPSCENSEQDLTSGSSTLTCSLTSAETGTFKSYPITVTANYGYYTEKTVSITVQGR